MLNAPAAAPDTLIPVPGVVAQPQPHTAPLTPDLLARENRRHDLILAGLVVLLGFLLASFPIINSDVFMSLRTGQMILQGEFPWGGDPFSHATSGRWVHTAWLWDVLTYAVFQIGGGVGLVLARGLLVTGLTLLLLSIRRRNVALFPVVATVALGLVTLSSRMLYRSELASVFLLAMTLYLLLAPASATGSGFLGRLRGWTRNRYWVFLPLVFALWANLDYWFFLGPLTVGLYLIGESLQGMGSATRVRTTGLTAEERRTLLFVFLIGTAACVLNPNHILVFQIPGELHSEALTIVGLRQPGAHQGFLRTDASPFGSVYFNSQLRGQFWFRPYGLSIAEWAYYPLVVLGLVSFYLGRAHWSLGRFFVWLAFFVLSAWQARNIGLFAVVAAPITALNLQDWLQARFGPLPSVERSWVAAGQLARIFALLLIVLASGLMFWREEAPLLQQRGRELPVGIIHSRALGWSLIVDPSLQATAEQLAEWQIPGKVLNLDWRDQPSYLAFFAPGIRNFLDQRFALHGQTARVYFDDVYHPLRDTIQGPSTAAVRDERWQAVLRDNDISCIVVPENMRVAFPNKNDPRPPERLVNLLLEDRGPDGRSKWEQLRHNDGRNFILAWTGSRHWPELQKLQYRPELEAFRQPTKLPPPHGPVITERPSPLSLWLSGEMTRQPLAYDESRWCLDHQGDEERQVAMEASRILFMPLVMVPGRVLAGLGMPPTPGVPARTTASLHLAVRAARRAIAENPGHADSYYQLYIAYSELAVSERDLGPPNPLRDFLATAAIRQAVVLQPGDPFFQLELANVYFRKGFTDLTVMHFERAMAAAASLGLGRAEFESRLKRDPRMGHLFPLLSRIEAEETSLRTRRAGFNARVQTTPDPAERARIAASQGLVDESRQAMEQFLQQHGPSSPSQQATFAFQQLVNLYLDAGFMNEAIELLSRPDAPDRLGPLNWFRRSSQVAAAVGDYSKAIKYRLEVDAILQGLVAERALAGVKIQTTGGAPDTMGSALAGIGPQVEALDLVDQRAEILMQAALLALEAGWTRQAPDNLPAATELFRRAILDVHPESPFRPLAERYHHLVTARWLTP